MDTTTFGRVAAFALSAGTFAFLFVSDAWRSDNLFLVPDLILCATLLGAALTPRHRATPVLLFAFGLAAGVLGASVASYAVDGRLGVGSLLGAVVAVVSGALLARQQATRPRSAEVA